MIRFEKIEAKLLVSVQFITTLNQKRDTHNDAKDGPNDGKGDGGDSVVDVKEDGAARRESRAGNGVVTSAVVLENVFGIQRREQNGSRKAWQGDENQYFSSSDRTGSEGALYPRPSRIAA